MHTTPLRSWNNSLILFWKYSGVDVIPNTSWLKWSWNLPNGVINVVSKADSFSSVIYQNFEFALILEKTFASPNWASMCSTDVVGCRTLWTPLFYLVRSTHCQIHILLSGLGTTTIAVHHSAGTSTIDMTPVFSILSSLVLTFGRRGQARHAFIII